MNFPVRFFTGCVILSALFLSCKKESFTTSAEARLRTTADTLHFDTVFTTTGSVTQVVKIVNDNRQGVRITSVRLAGGSSSSFRINVNGIPGPEVRDVEVQGYDSAYIFVSVNINPGASSLPFIVQDSIEVVWNGNRKFIQLDAFGQNARFLRSASITSSTTWTGELPYVILGGLTVEENVRLTLAQGTRVYLHADAPLIIKGTLIADGAAGDSLRVVLTGDRRDDPYRDFPASWPGIIFTSTSSDNRLTYTTIKNAYQGIVLQEPSANTTARLVLTNSIIDNAYDAGIFAVNSSISAQNLLVSNCGKNLLLVKGGRYDFNHCTVASLSGTYVPHKDPVLLLSNFININNTIISAPLDARFRNCIFWGEQNGLVENEVVVARSGSNPYNVVFDHVLWRVQSAPGASSLISIINNKDPKFDSVNTARRIYSFRLKDGSPALNAGTASSLLNDLDGAPRPVGLPDLGAYEKQ
jgi:hypothetical protein